MHVIHPVTGEGAAVVKPRIFRLFPLRLFASILVPLDVRLDAQHARTLFAAGNVARHEGPDVHPHAVVDPAG